MEQENLKLGRINRAIEKALEVNFETDVWIYVEGPDLDRMAAKWPSLYLTRLEEASKIIRNPDYASYHPENKILFLIKEYLREGKFIKVFLEIEKTEEWHLKSISVLSDLKAHEIDQGSGIRRIEK